jgi:GTPase Era involved in 16S rRNA processing
MTRFAASEFRELLHWADNLAAVMQKRGRDDLVNQIETAKTDLCKNTFTLAVLGKAKRGKSTLINALLGRKDDLVAPIDKLPASSAITLFRIGAEKATVIYKDNRTESIPYSRIGEFVTEENNPQNRKNVAMLEVEGAFANLPNQVELVDTPGAGSIHEHHDALLHAFIPQADAVIFILTARMPLDQDELELLQKVKKADINKIFFVLNKIDESEQNDIESAINHNEKLLAQNGINVGNFHRISAKNAFLGRDGSHVPELIEDVGRFIVENKGRILRQRFLSQVNGIIETETRSLEVALASASKTSEELDVEIEQFQKQKSELKGKNTAAMEHKFSRKWEEAVNDFNDALPKAKRRVRDTVVAKIQDTWNITAIKLSKELPSFILQEIEDEINQLLERFYNTTKMVCDEFSAEYPDVSIDQNRKIVIRTKLRMSETAGGIAGLIASLSGYGLSSWGASAAATTCSIWAPLSFGTAALGTIATSIGPFVMVGGLLVLPYMWWKHGDRKKNEMERDAVKKIDQQFDYLRESIRDLKVLGERIVEGSRNKLEDQIQRLENSLQQAKTHRPSESELKVLREQNETINRLVAQGVEWFNAS